MPNSVIIDKLSTKTDKAEKTNLKNQSVTNGITIILVNIGRRAGACSKKAQFPVMRD